MAAVLVVPGICRFCGCTDERACLGGCTWLNVERTVCSSRACLDAYFAEARAIVDRLLHLIHGTQVAQAQPSPAQPSPAQPSPAQEFEGGAAP